MICRCGSHERWLQQGKCSLLSYTDYCGWRQHVHRFKYCESMKVFCEILVYTDSRPLKSFQLYGMRPGLTECICCLCIRIYLQLKNLWSWAENWLANKSTCILVPIACWGQQRCLDSVSSLSCPWGISTGNLLLNSICQEGVGLTTVASSVRAIKSWTLVPPLLFLWATTLWLSDRIRMDTPSLSLAKVVLYISHIILLPSKKEMWLILASSNLVSQARPSHSSAFSSCRINTQREGQAHSLYLYGSTVT